MTREEQKARDAKKYYPNDLNCYYAFLHGAEWADKHPNLESLWHDASEEPKEYPIIYQDKLSDVWILQFSLKDFVDGWENFKGSECITRWAYISDLLPKENE